VSCCFSHPVLVDSIVQVIQSLPDEDRLLLRDRLRTDLFSILDNNKATDLVHNTETSDYNNTQSQSPQHAPNLNIPPISTLSDNQIIALTELQMETSQDQRLSQLLQIQQERAITTTEQSELAMLMEIYQSGLMRKAQALNESVKRGLRQPLSL